MSTSPQPIIASEQDLKTFLSSIPSSCTLYLDFEGNNLSRNGTLSVVTILVHPQGLTRLIDVFTLGKAAFDTTTDTNKTLKSIFEDPNIPKGFWDVRNDADALWAHYKVGLKGVIDIQLLENASRTDSKEYLRGLDICVQQDLKLGVVELSRWTRTKQDVKRLMSSNIFSVRPMNPKTVKYCANDVAHLPKLHEVYKRRIKPDWLAKAITESARRAEEAKSPRYNPQGPNKALGPWGRATEKKTLPLEDFLEHLEDQRLDRYDDEYDDFIYDDEEYDDYFHDDDFGY